MNVQDFKLELFEKAKEYGFSDVEMYYEKTNLFNCEIDQGEVDQYQTSEEMGVSFRGLYNEKMGYAYSEKLDHDSIEFLLENAKDNALIMEDPDQEEIFEGSKDYDDINFYSKTLDSITNDQLMMFLKELDKEIYACDERVIGTGFLSAQSGELEKALFNNKGLSLIDHKNVLGFGYSVIVKENNITKTADQIKFINDLSELNPKGLAKEVVDEALSYLNSITIDNKSYPVLLRHDAAAKLIAAFTPIFSAENVQKGMSQLNEREGDQIAGTNISLIDDPFKQGSMFSRTFDAEGVATGKTTIVEKGKLNTLLYNQKTAKKAGKTTTGHAYKNSYKGSLTIAPSNIYIESGEESYNQMIEGIDEGVIITGLSGLHSGVNAVSGDFSLASTGYFVKDGKIEKATKQLTIAGNFYEMINDIKKVGDDLDFTIGFGISAYVGSPSLLVNKLSVTSE